MKKLLAAIFVVITSIGSADLARATDACPTPGGTGTNVCIFADIIELKSLDGPMRLRDGSDPTKVATLSMAGITAGTTRAFAFPDLAGTFALTANNLGVFASTTSAQLASVLSDESGTGGGFVRSTSPTIGGSPNISSDSSGAFLWADTSFEIRKASDATSRFKFSATGISASTTRTYTAPDADGTLMLGSGTSGTIAKFTGTNTLGNSVLTDNGTDLSTTGSLTSGNYTSGNTAVIINGNGSYNQMVFKMSGDTASQLAGFTWQNNSLATVANVWMTGNASAGIWRWQLAGTGSFDFNHNTVAIAANTPTFRIQGAASTVTYLQANGGTTGNAAVLSAQGETNVDLTLAPNGTGKVKFGNAASFTANGSVATTMTSLGPTGANTTVQEWLTVKNSSGTTRYIPAY